MGRAKLTRVTVQGATDVIKVLLYTAQLILAISEVIVILDLL